jgi:hypothetical protein
MPRLSRPDAQLIVKTLGELLQSDSARADALVLRALVQRLSRRLVQSEATCECTARGNKSSPST